MKKLLTGLLVLVMLFLANEVSAQVTGEEKPKILVAINVRSPDFIVRKQEFKIVYAQMQNNHIPLLNYDFKAALTDELILKLNEDTRYQWQLAAESDGIEVQKLMDDKKLKPPTKEGFKYLLMVDVTEYGAVLNWLHKVSYIAANLRLVDPATGKKIWSQSKGDDPGREYHRLPRVKLPKPIAELQTNNQAELKEIVNQTIEKFCQQAPAELRKKNFK
jgi:hypothetical protein